MREVAPGLWHWQASHPQWEPGEPWGPEVSSYAIDDGERLVLFDPLATPADFLELADARQTAIVLTAPWHERDARRLIEELGVPLHSPRPDTAQDLMQKFGITAEQAGDGSPDLAWLRSHDTIDWHPYAAGDRLPFAIEAFAGREGNDMVLWVEDRNALLTGDTIGDFGEGLQLNPWLRGGVTRDELLARLRPLLDRPIEHVLPAHGATGDRAALDRAVG